jgi:hypothetical protein
VLSDIKDLQELIADFDLITEIAYDLSQQFDGVNTDNRRGKVSTYYLAKMVPECMSLLRLLPGSRFTASGDLFDFPSFCSVSRNLIEASNLHWYYSVDNISLEISEFRFLLYDFHDYRSMIHIGEFIGVGEHELNVLRTKYAELKNAIKNNSVFDEVSSDVQRQILKGRKCSDFDQTEIARRRGLDIEEFRGVYKLLSTNTHSTPFAINAVVDERLRGEGGNEAFACLILPYVAKFVADTIRTTGLGWGIEFAKEKSEKVIEFYSVDFCVCT